MLGKNEILGKSTGKLESFYKIEKEIGSGSYGRVYKVKHLLTGETRACKQLTKGKISDIEKFTLEVNILSKMDHPNIIKLYEIFEDTKYIYLVMEECLGGELFDRILDHINRKVMFTEREAASLFKQIMSAICYCHSQNICHRDLKPENLLLLNDREDSPLKVIDFGLSRLFSLKDHKMTTKVGTAYYVSPEVLSGNYDEKCDIWSAGVILYILLTGDPPFNGANDNEIYRRIQAKKFSFPSPVWDKISNDAKDLIKHMLCDPQIRYTAEQILAHTWVKNLAPNSLEVVLELNVNNLKSYVKTNKLKRAVLTFIATWLKDDDVKLLKEIFNSLDINKDGTLTKEEIRVGFETLNFGGSLSIDEIFKSIDVDKSGNISYSEFIAAAMDPKMYLKEERLYEAFKAFDKDNSGKISLEEIRSVLNDDGSSGNIEQLIKEYDSNNDGEIDYNEFIMMMSKIEI